MQPSGHRQRKTNSGARISALRRNQRALTSIESADRYPEAIGYTEHGFRHCDIDSKTVCRILKKLNCDESVAALAIDTRISRTIEYFEISLKRVSSCRKAEHVLCCEFNLFINTTRMA